MHAEKALSKEDRKSIKVIQRMTLIKIRRDNDLYKARLEGKAELTLEIARKLKVLGDPPEKIQAITGLPSDTLASL